MRISDKTKRKVSVVIGLTIIVVGIFVSIKISDLPRKEKGITEEKVSMPKVQIRKVKLQTTPIWFEASGMVTAKHKVEIYSDVTGNVLNGTKQFKPGTRFLKDEPVLLVDKKEKEFTLFAAKEDFYSLLVSLLPDIQSDFPENYEALKNYTDNLSLTEKLPPFPEAKSEKEKYYLSAKKVYYKLLSIRSTETNLEKYTIKAPFDGIITDGDINPGTLVRNSQKLGEFIKEGVFEIKIDIPAELLKDVKVGNKVEISGNRSKEKLFVKVSRINSSVNSETQTISIFAEAKNTTFLKDGMYFMCKVYLEEHHDSWVIDKKFLTPDNRILQVINNKIQYITPTILGSLGNSVIIGDIPDNIEVVCQLFPNAFKGMPVETKPVNEKE